MNAATPNSIAYSATIYALWSAQALNDKSTCAVQPTSTEYVAAIVKILTQWKCHFSVKSGGHTLSAGAASINKLLRDHSLISHQKYTNISIFQNSFWIHFIILLDYVHGEAAPTIVTIDLATWLNTISADKDVSVACIST
ncbi:hypothetical protein DSL72_007460 [Monilinia vaccinii-corymbosi]|uniref:FAD linked oxidase N-terminal domain-containing protein n=1 Tax=Monilinia vaccinii-corymbosi TaxID=61207 RepID=A0A8A3PN40_9HELO|nr:hypothetical protein DSL72_007460 [Monilinia vaccinii-corymbosi]